MMVGWLVGWLGAFYCGRSGHVKFTSSEDVIFCDQDAAASCPALSTLLRRQMMDIRFYYRKVRDEDGYICMKFLIHRLNVYT
jgi:hypothetical protein